MRQIEKEIVRAMWDIWKTGKSRRLSERDEVRDVPEKGVFYRLHGTVVAHVRLDGSIQTWTGGWRTNTTKSRINAIMRGFTKEYGIYQKDFEWYWSNYYKDGVADMPYDDGDTVKWNSDGNQVIVKSIM